MLPEKNKILLGAYYYLWWGRPILPLIGGGIWKGGYTNQPLLAEYNSRAQSVITQHLAWAEEAGLSFLAINWHDAESWDDLTLKNYFLAGPQNSRIRFCFHYDSSLALNRLGNFANYDFAKEYLPGKTKGEKFLEDFEYLANNYFNHPQYLKIDNLPLVIIYNVSAFRNNSKYFAQLKEKMEKKNISLFLVADVVCWAGVKFSKNNLAFLWQTAPQETLKVFSRALRRLSLKSYESDFRLSQYFKGITGYNLFASNRTKNFLENIDKLYQRFQSYAISQDLHFIPNIMPGYDDRALKGFKRPILAREKGEFYQNFWQIAEKYLDPSLKIALITSFNEWHEGTEIEPSKEYGTNYLELTKLFKGQIN